MQSVDEPQSMGSAGARLAAARREQGLTIPDVSARTRIRASLISQIEQDDFSHCGGTVYARGHLRSIATTLGLDPGPVLAAYDASHEGETGPVLVIPSSEFDPLRGESRGRRGRFRWGPAMIFSLVVVCALAAIALLLPGSSADDDPASGPSRPAPATPTQSVAPPASAPASAPPTTPPPVGVNVVLAAKDAQSWLEVRDDTKRVLLQQLLQSGDSRTVTAEGALHIKMGNAGAVDVSCNGKNLGPSGGLGEVVTIRVALGASGACTVGDDAAGDVAAAPLPGPPATPRGPAVD